MIRQNLHTHTIYDDGKNTPMEMAEAALRAGLSSLGFSGHSVLPFPNDWCMTEDTLPQYLAAVSETKAAFAGRLAVYCGLEWDVLSGRAPAGYDYIIGSVHHIPQGAQRPSVDEAPDVTRGMLRRFYGDSADAMAQAYYAQYAALAGDPGVDIIGHFDLITKFDETDGFFDETSPVYRDAAMAAMETLLLADKLFEVNTGAMSRGWRTSPYPAMWLLRELRAHNARVLVTSDAHAAESVTHAFRETEELLRSLGFREIWEYTPGGFCPVGI